MKNYLSLSLENDKEEQEISIRVEILYLKSQKKTTEFVKSTEIGIQAHLITFSEEGAI